MASVKDQIIRKRKPTSIMEHIRRKLAGKGNLTLTEKAAILTADYGSGKGGRMKTRSGLNVDASSGKGGRGKGRKPVGGKKVKSDPRVSIKPGSMPKARPKTDPRVSMKPGSMPKSKPKGDPRVARKPGSMPSKKAPAGRGDIGKVGSMPRKSGAPKTSKPPMKRPTQAIKAAAKPKPGKPNIEPRTIAQAKKMGKLYFVDKNGKKKAAVTAEDLKKSGHKTLRAYLNAKGKPAKKGK